MTDWTGRGEVGEAIKLENGDYLLLESGSHILYKTGLDWEERTTATSPWEDRNQVLWSPFINLWEETFYPWQVEDRIETSTYTERTQPTTNYTNRSKPTTNWT